MRTKAGGVAAAVVAVGLLMAVGCAKDGTVATSETTTPVTASSSGSGSDPAESTTTPDDEDADKGSGSYDEVCSLIEEIEDVQEDDFSDAIDLMGDARDASPDELADSWDTLIEAFEDLSSVPRGDEAEEEAVIAMFEDPDFLDAAATIDDFAEEECGLDITLDPADEDEPDIGIDDEETDESIGAPSDGSVDPTSIQAIQAHMEDNYGSEVWWPVLDDAEGWRMTGGVDPTLTITLSATSDWESLSTEELEDACDAVADYLDTVVESDAGVEIRDPIEELDLVSRYFRGEACAPEEGF